MLFKFQWRIEKLMSDLFFATGLSWTSPLRDIKIVYTYVAIDRMAATARKDNTQKYLVLLNDLRFNVSNIKRIKININLMSLR